MTNSATPHPDQRGPHVNAGEGKPSPLIRLRGITKIYPGRGEDVVPLRELDLDIARGDFVALMGPSGSGKTTLLHLLAGIDRTTHGSIQIGGVDITRMRSRALAKWRNQHVGFIFQQYNLVPVLNAWENVELPLLLMPLSRSERAHKVDVALQAVGLSDRADHLPREMSGGQQQRVAIARAIVGGPELILADEPTGNLDEDSADAVLGLLRQLHSRFGQTLVMVTHDPRAAEAAERVIRLRRGQIQDSSSEATSPARESSAREESA